MPCHLFSAIWLIGSIKCWKMLNNVDHCFLKPPITSLNVSFCQRHKDFHLTVINVHIEEAWIREFRLFLTNKKRSKSGWSINKLVEDYLKPGLREMWQAFISICWYVTDHTINQLIEKMIDGFTNNGKNHYRQVIDMLRQCITVYCDILWSIC